MLIEIYGGSDDIIGYRVDGGRKAGGKQGEIGGSVGGDGRYSRSLTVTTVGGSKGVRVHAIYDGCWSFAVGQIEEGRQVPKDWTFGIDMEHEYSTRLLILADEMLIVTPEDKTH